MKRWHEDAAAIPVFSGLSATCWGYFFNYERPIWFGFAWTFLGLSARAIALAMDEP